MVSNPEIDEPRLRNDGEVPFTLSFKEAFYDLVLGIMKPFYLHVETDTL